MKATHRSSPVPAQKPPPDLSGKLPALSGQDARRKREDEIVAGVTPKDDWRKDLKPVVDDHSCDLMDGSIVDGLLMIVAGVVFASGHGIWATSLAPVSP